MPSFLCLSQQRMFLSHQIDLLFLHGSGSSLSHPSPAHKSLFMSRHHPHSASGTLPGHSDTSAVLAPAGLSQVTPIFPG